MKENGKTSSQRQSVRLAGREIQYKEMGSGEPALILLHGLSGDLNGWALNQRVLAADRRVIAIDLPGHGRSTRDIGDGTAPVLAAMLADLPDALGLERFHLLGLSFGGAIALDLASILADRRDRRLESLTCLSAGGLGTAVNTDFIYAYLRAETRDAMQAALSQVFHDERMVNDAMVYYGLLGRADPAFRDGIETMITANFTGQRQRFDYTGTARDLSVPVNVIWGRQDRIIPVEHGEALADSRPVHIFDECGHMPNVEMADRFNGLVAKILQQVERENSSGRD
jgi:pyruvate dehydrogenase E2 component (dihydrolipoamide acetyltransferase)